MFAISFPNPVPLVQAQTQELSLYYMKVVQYKIKILTEVRLNLFKSLRGKEG